MSQDISRRNFLARGWKTAVALIAAAGAWTSWDVLRPGRTSGLGGKVRALPEAEVSAETTQYVREAQAYLTRHGGEVVALWQKCPHLGCRVAWCESSGEFECPCHGSTFNRIGEHRTGPSPSGMERFEATVVDGVVEVDTGVVLSGPPLGTETLDEPRRGDACTEEG